MIVLLEYFVYIEHPIKVCDGALYILHFSFVFMRAQYVHVADDLCSLHATETAY